VFAKMDIKQTVNKNTDVMNIHFTENPDKVYLTKEEKRAKSLNGM